ncbi:hypothetical protein Cs7R123_26340 [Catellatospora sp. TT07R-123]|nr:hypothetical protein Cs7R123_26340 [Catellatospora sp. TT07R-123]
MEHLRPPAGQPRRVPGVHCGAMPVQPHRRLLPVWTECGQRTPRMPDLLQVAPADVKLRHSAARPASNLATGTRNGEQDT